MRELLALDELATTKAKISAVLFNAAIINSHGAAVIAHSGAPEGHTAWKFPHGNHD